MRLGYLIESKITADNLDPNIFFIVEHSNKSAKFSIINKRRPRYLIGQIYIVPIRESKYFTCHCTAAHGYGPLLYDIALEWVSRRGSGIIPARGCGQGYNSINSIKTWKYYYENRTDVQHFPFKHDESGQFPWLYCIYVKPNDSTLTSLKDRIVQKNKAKWELGEFGTHGIDPESEMRDTNSGNIQKVGYDMTPDRIENAKRNIEDLKWRKERLRKQQV